MKRSFSILLLLPLLVGDIAFAQTTAIVGGTVHTMGPNGTIENATVVIRDGQIQAVGSSIPIPAGSKQIDASGKIITPGLFTPFGFIGLQEINRVPGTVDSVQRGDVFSASFDIADAYNYRSTLIPVNRIEGVTRALVAPKPAKADDEGNSSRVMSGLAAVVHFGDGHDYLVHRGAALVVNLGETGSALAAGSRAAALLQLRMALDDAIDYSQHRDAYASRQRREYSLSHADLEALQPVVSGDRPLLVHINRASDIEALLRLARKYRLQVVILGGAEAWMVADQLAAAGASVVLRATENLPTDFDRLNARLESAALLQAAGVTISFADSRNHTHNARNITQSAGNAVANGLPWIEGLRAITLSPAEMYGVADRVGSIETGKDADLVIWSDDPLELTSFPEQVFIQGQPIPMESRQTLLRDRYFDQDPAIPPAFR